MAEYTRHLVVLGWNIEFHHQFFDDGSPRFSLLSGEVSSLSCFLYFKIRTLLLFLNGESRLLVLSFNDEDFPLCLIVFDVSRPLFLCSVQLFLILVLTNLELWRLPSLWLVFWGLYWSGIGGSGSSPFVSVDLFWTSFSFLTHHALLFLPWSDAISQMVADGLRNRLTDFLANASRGLYFTTRVPTPWAWYLKFLRPTCLKEADRSRQHSCCSRWFCCLVEAPNVQRSWNRSCLRSHLRRLRLWLFD